jgi:hypothetical protein
MHLDDHELRELADLLVKREPGVNWLTRLQDARAAGRLGLTVRAVARRHPGDPMLAEVAALVAPTRWPRRVAAGAAMALLAAIAVVIAWPEAELAPPPLAASPPVAVAIAEPPPTVSVPAAEPHSTATSAPAASAAPTSAVAPAIHQPVPAGCAGKHGLVGYWYAGERAPGQVGDTLVLDHGANVRADYPDTHNHFNARAAVRCVLSRGDRVALTQAPIAVPGGAWWVPLVLP